MNTKSDAAEHDKLKGGEGAGALPPIPDRLHTPWTRLEAACERYIDDYELRDAEDADGNSGDYTPNDTERMLITDCVMGLLCDKEIIALIKALPEGE